MQALVQTLHRPKEQKPVRRPALTALALVVVLAALSPALAHAQSLNGQIVDVSVRDGVTGPTSGLAFAGPGPQTVTPGGATFTSVAYISTVVTPGQVMFTNFVSGGTIRFRGTSDPGSSGYFFGFAVAETGSSPVTITGLRVDPATTVTGFDPSRLLFTPTAVYANFNNAFDNNDFRFNPGQNLTLDLTFAPAAVPEPSPALTFAMAGLGLGGLMVLARRKKGVSSR